MQMCVGFFVICERFWMQLCSFTDNNTFYIECNGNGTTVHVVWRSEMSYVLLCVYYEPYINKLLYRVLTTAAVVLLLHNQNLPHGPWDDNHPGASTEPSGHYTQQ